LQFAAQGAVWAVRADIRHPAKISNMSRQYTTGRGTRMEPWSRKLDQWRRGLSTRSSNDGEIAGVCHSLSKFRN